MESTLPHVIASSELTPVNGKGATPFAQQTVVLTKQAYIELTWQAHYWRAQYEQLVERETALKAEVEAHQATIRDFTQRLYGTKSEKATHLKPAQHTFPGRSLSATSASWKPTAMPSRAPSGVGPRCLRGSSGVDAAGYA